MRESFAQFSLQIIDRSVSKKVGLEQAISAFRAALSGTVDISHYNSLLKEMLEFNNRKPQFLNESFLLLEAMAEAKIKPNEETFTILSLVMLTETSRSKLMVR